jgi:hypothetical protein
MRQLTSARHRDERGAVGILFGVLLGVGVLFGMVALAFDYGNLNANHSQLQSSADAAALLAARTCATSPNGCADLDQAALDAISQDNDNDPTGNHPSSVYAYCGRDPDGVLPPLDTPPCKNPKDDRITVCPDLSWGGNFVEVGTTKETGTVFAGNGKDGDISGHACAAVAWGPVSGYHGPAPFTFSACEWQTVVGGDPLAGGGLNYAPAPPYPPYPDSGFEHPILLESKSSVPCTTFNGHDAPGGFGWLATGVGCVQSVPIGGWVQVDTGNNVPNGCTDQIQAMLGHVVPIPVYDCMNSTPTMPAPSDCHTGNGSHLYYHIAGYAGFYVTGWQLPGTSQHSIASGGAACGSGEKCVEGFFVKDVVTGDIDPGGGDPDFGLTAIKTIG